MTTINKIAEAFQQKLVFAANTNLQNLNSLLDATKALVLSEPLWMTAAGNDPYAESDIEGAIKAIKTLNLDAKQSVDQYGLNQSGYARYLDHLGTAIRVLEGVSLKANLDPQASDKIDAVKRSLEHATSNYVPIGIPAQKVQQTTVLPETTIVGDKPETTEGETGVGFNSPENEADPDKLSDVVDSLQGQYKSDPIDTKY